MRTWLSGHEAVDRGGASALSDPQSIAQPPSPSLSSCLADAVADEIIMDSTATVSAVAAAISTTVKLTEKVFEIRAVDKQARSLLETINEVNGQLDVARELRRQKTNSLNAVEKEMMDTTFYNTERAIGHVAKLVEPCRVAMETTGGDVGLGTRLMFVLRDSPNIQVSLTRLGLVSQSLHTALLLLCSRDSSPMVTAMPTFKTPPSYEESQFLTASRARNMLRKASSNVSLMHNQDDSAYPDFDSLAVFGDSEKRRAPDLFYSSDTGLSSLAESEPSRNETGDARRDFAPQYAGQFLPYLPYRPGPLNMTTTTPPPELPIPGSLRPSSWESMHSKAISHAIIREPSVSPAATSQGKEWTPSPALWDKPFRSPSGTPASISDRSATDSVAGQASTFDAGCTFALPGDATGFVPRPIFSRMVKLDGDMEAEEPIRRVMVSLRRKPGTGRGNSMPGLESEFPEAVVEPGLQVVSPRESEFPEVFIPHDMPLSTAEPITLVTDVPAGMLDAARQRRLEHERDKHGLDRSRAQTKRHTQPIGRKTGLSTSAAEHTDTMTLPRRWSEANQLQPPSRAVMCNDPNPLQTPLTGRARSQRWREMQFERFERLQDASSTT